MQEHRQRDSTAFVRRFGIALIIVFTAIIIALFIVLFTVDFDDDGDDEASEGTGYVPGALVLTRYA